MIRRELHEGDKERRFVNIDHGTISKAVANMVEKTSRF